MVYKAVCARTGCRVAVKLFVRSEECAREAAVFKRLTVGSADTALWSAYPRFLGSVGQALIMELCDTDLATRARDLAVTEEVIDVVNRGIRRALSHMHAAHLVHLDVKLRNLLWVDLSRRAVLTDFSLTEPVDALVPVRLQNTVGYRPPELLHHDDSETRPARLATDWWAFGVVLWELAHVAKCKRARHMFPESSGAGGLRAHVEQYVRHDEASLLRRIGRWGPVVGNLCHRDPSRRLYLARGT